MDFYKRLIRSRETRLKILRLMRWIPDTVMIRLQYRIKTGNKLNLKNPRRFTEKLQWYKLNYRDLGMVRCVDKYDVRRFVEEKGLGHILNDCYGVFNDPGEMDVWLLPDKFVLKDTLGGGGNAVIIIQDKSAMNEARIRTAMQKWVDIPILPDGGREWPYYHGKKHRIMVEKLIESDPAQGGLVDYKFFCFDGVPKYLYVIADRNLGVDAGLGIFDIGFHRIACTRLDEISLKRVIEKPHNYDEMIDIAAALSEGFPHVRVDLYNQDGKIIFGEMTFFDGSGYMRFDPDEFDFIMGGQFRLPPVTREDM